MSGTPESSIFGKMTSRAAGKRQIKPTAVLYATLTDNHESDEEDDDFEVKIEENAKKRTDSGSDSSSDSGSASSNSDDSDGSDEEESEENDGSDAESGDEPTELEKRPSNEHSEPVCSVCINTRNAVAAGDFMQCDKCGIHVHDNCYGGVPIEDTEETRWFCEPCSAGLTDPPHCEMCPSRLGAFKRADIPGRWCHVVCALFTHGVAFAQVETLTGISWDTLENSLFGRRTCSACSDKIEARLGIASRCESGMCKEHLHVTCAQRLGLLVDETDDDHETECAVMRYFFCKKHTSHDNLKPLQKRFAQWEKAERRRMAVHRRRKALDADEEALRIQMWDTLKETLSETQERSDVVGDRQKQARLLNTSAEFFDRFETKAEDAGMSREAFRDPFFNIKLTNTSHIPIGFSKEYIDFMSLRDSTIIPEEEEKLRKVRETLDETKKKHAQKSASKKLGDKFAANSQRIEQKLEVLAELDSLLRELAADKNDDFSSVLAAYVDRRATKATTRNSAERRGTPQTAAAASSSSSAATAAMNSAKKKKTVAEMTCDVCHLTTDQHKQTQCDQCQKSYHIGCLTPPLTRLPKRNNVGWICHVCNESSDSEPEIMETSDDGGGGMTTRATRSRRPPARLSSFLSH